MYGPTDFHTPAQRDRLRRILIQIEFARNIIDEGRAQPHAVALMIDALIRLTQALCNELDYRDGVTADTGLDFDTDLALLLDAEASKPPAPPLPPGDPQERDTP
jgi:hypothetical protein